MSEPDFFADHLHRVPAVAILRGHSPERTAELAETAWEAGIELVEVTVETATSYASLESAIAAASGRGTFVGAGTVTTADQVRRVTRMGAAFLVSPGLHPAVVAQAAEDGIPYLPGVATATEIAAALERGLSWLKAFPAAQLGPDWIRAQLGPFPRARFVATGGISAANAPAFLAAGCGAVAIGSALNAETIRALTGAARRPPPPLRVP